jgi:hypothetical protein
MTTAAGNAAAEEASELAFEAFLAGRPVPAEGADLAAFAGAVRMSATEPGRPSAALAELLVTGLLVDQPPLSTRTAKRRRRPMWFFTALIAKIASASAVAQAATGAGIVLVSFTGLGAAHALPAPVQHTFSTVVSAISPAGDGATSSDMGTTPPATTSDTAAPTTDPADSTDSADSAGALAPTDAATVTTAPKNFGETVSKDARDGGVDGQTISGLAHDRNAARRSGETEAQTPETDASDTDASETDAPETDAPETDGSQDGSNGGHGHSAHSGHGGH